jgi:hypothetical protein
MIGMATRFRILMTRRGDMPAEVRVVKESYGIFDDCYRVVWFGRREEAEQERAKLAAKNPGWCYTVDEVKS